MLRRTILTAFVAATTCAVALVSTPAHAATAVLGSPSGAHVVAATPSSFTVALNPAAYATKYRVFASTTKSNVYIANIAKARASAYTASPRITLGGLTYTTAAYYYRVETLNSTQHHFDTVIRTVGLQPATPANLTLTTESGAPFLSWTSGAVTGFDVDQATDAAMTADRRTYTIRGQTLHLTPYNLTTGATYYYRLRARNQQALSGYSAQVHTTVDTHEQVVRAMTYNVVEANLAGMAMGGSVLAPWDERRAGVVSLIEQGAPDIVGIEEAAAWIGEPQGYGGTRQIDDLRSALGNYSLARTEIPPTEHGYYRVASYILYRTDTYEAVGDGGHWAIGGGYYAAYQQLRNRISGATVLAVVVHLPGGSGADNDTIRQHLTESMTTQAEAMSAEVKSPVVYTGDFNSDLAASHAFDGPGVAMREAQVVDSQKAAQALYYAQYNSCNQYLRTPPAAGDSIDYVYAAPGVAVHSRVVLVRLVGGKFVGVIPSDHNPVQATLFVRY